MSDWRFPSDVIGWLTEKEGEALRDLAAGKTVLEIGSYCGRSTIAMAQVAKRVHSVDWHRGDWGTGESDTLGSMWANLETYGVRNRVVLHVGRTETVLPMLAGPFDLIFIDGAHDAHSVRRDTVAALHLSPTIIAWHDYADRYGDVKRVVDELTQGRVETVDSLAWWHTAQ